jgi:hypothetical protein
MRDTTADSSTDPIPDLAESYFPRFAADPRYGPQPPDPLDFSCFAGAGAFVSTPSDLVRFAMAMSSGKLLKPATWELAWTPVTVNGAEKRDYGFGWSVDTFRDRKRVHHGGGINGFVSYMTRFPQEKLTVIVLTNSEVSDPNGIATAVAAAYVPALKPAEVKVVEDSDPALTKRLRGVVESLVRGDAKPEEFTDEMRRRLFPDKVKEVRGVGLCLTVACQDRQGGGHALQRDYRERRRQDQPFQPKCRHV